MHSLHCSPKGLRRAPCLPPSHGVGICDARFHHPYLSFKHSFYSCLGCLDRSTTVQDGWIEDVCITKGSGNERDGAGRIKSERLRQRGIDREGFAPIEIEGEG